MRNVGVEHEDRRLPAYERALHPMENVCGDWKGEGSPTGESCCIREGSVHEISGRS